MYQQSCKIVNPGDTVTVHSGTYREWVNPLYGGQNHKNRIIFRAAEEKKAIIKGSEVISNWEKQKSGIWKTVIDNSLFGDNNPYNTEIKSDWFFNLKSTHHTGQVYLNEIALYEVDSLHEVIDNKIIDSRNEFSKHKWYCEVDDEKTTIYANFQKSNPNKELVEINVRKACLFPKSTGINYITVRGFKISQAATQWAPFTAEQEGLIGPNWSKGWIIENNEISNSRCVGISLGKERSTGQNKWGRLNMKHGTQVQRELVFNALKNGWNKESIGSHIVRNNTIHSCGQAGVVGHLGCIFSEIYNNHIYDICSYDQFTGYEIAGIKLHAGIDVVVRDNCIHNVDRGIWMDWQAQGARLSSNLLFNNDIYDLHIEVNHGPHIVDNNICLSSITNTNMSQGGLYINNIFYGALRAHTVLDRFTPYHYEHSTMVAGLMTIQGGDDRFYQNIFIKPKSNLTTWDKTSYGLSYYNSFPSFNDKYGNDIIFNTDYLKRKRSENQIVGPLIDIQNKKMIQIWPK